MGVQIALDENLDSPCGRASPIYVIGNDRAGTGANVGSISRSGIVRGKITGQGVVMSVCVYVLSLVRVLSAGSCRRFREAIVSLLIVGKEL